MARLEGSGARGALPARRCSAAFRIYNTVGFGYLESVYEKCMLLEIRNAGLRVVRQQPIDVTYAAQPVGYFIADLVVDSRVIVELKSTRRLHKVYEAQLVNYLVATGFDLGLLINFGAEHVEIRRKVRCL